MKVRGSIHTMKKNMTFLLVVCVLIMLPTKGIFAQSKELISILENIKTSSQFKEFKSNNLNYYFVPSDSNANIVDVWVAPNEFKVNYSADQYNNEAFLKDYVIDTDALFNEELYSFISGELPKDIQLNIYITSPYEPKISKEPVKYGPLYQYQNGQMLNNYVAQWHDEKYPYIKLLEEINELAQNELNGVSEIEVDYQNSTFYIYTVQDKLPEHLYEAEDYEIMKYLSENFEIDNQATYEQISKMIAEKMGSNVNLITYWLLKNPWEIASYEDGTLVSTQSNYYSEEYNKYYRANILPNEIISKLSEKKYPKTNDIDWHLNYKDEQFSLTVKPNDAPEEINDYTQYRNYIATTNTLEYPKFYQRLSKDIEKLYGGPIDLTVTLSNQYNESVPLFTYQSGELTSSNLDNILTDYDIYYRAEILPQKVVESINNKKYRVRNLDWLMVRDAESYYLYIMPNDLPHELKDKNSNEFDKIELAHYLAKTNQLDYIDFYKEVENDLEKGLETPTNFNIVLTNGDATHLICSVEDGQLVDKAIAAAMADSLYYDKLSTLKDNIAKGVYGKLNDNYSIELHTLENRTHEIYLIDNNIYDTLNYSYFNILLLNDYFYYVSDLNFEMFYTSLAEEIKNLFGQEIINIHFYFPECDKDYIIYQYTSNGIYQANFSLAESEIYATNINKRINFVYSKLNNILENQKLTSISQEPIFDIIIRNIALGVGDHKLEYVDRFKEFRLSQEFKGGSFADNFLADIVIKVFFKDKTESHDLFDAFKKIVSDTLGPEYSFVYEQY